MLGESHSLLNDFGEHAEIIQLLIEKDEAFRIAAEKYNKLDVEIRELELNSAPIDDQAMHQLKHDRAELKDQLFAQINGATR